MTPDRDYLGPLERRVMTELWRHGPRTVNQVLDALNAGSPRKLAYTTVMTILFRLYEKGYLSRRAVRRSYVYEPVMSERELTERLGRRDLHRLIERYGAASVARFAEELRLGDTGLTKRLHELAAEEREPT